MCFISGHMSLQRPGCCGSLLETGVCCGHEETVTKWPNPTQLTSLSKSCCYSHVSGNTIFFLMLSEGNYSSISKDYIIILPQGYSQDEEFSVDGCGYSRNYLLRDGLCSEDFVLLRKKVLRGKKDKMFTWSCL